MRAISDSSYRRRHTQFTPHTHNNGNISQTDSVAFIQRQMNKWHDNNKIINSLVNRYVQLSVSLALMTKSMGQRQGARKLMNRAGVNNYYFGMFYELHYFHWCRRRRHLGALTALLSLAPTIQYSNLCGLQNTLK